MTETRTRPPEAPKPPKSHRVEQPPQATVKLKPTKSMPIRAGAFELRKSGVGRYDLKDPYHILVTATWRAFLLGMVGAYVLINIVFALLYLAEPGSVANLPHGSFLHAFFFSVETLATVGYGVMAPATIYGHAVASTEIICGMAFTAIATGLIFVRFSRPRARILYADSAVITVRNGVPTLMVRIANGRMTVLTNARAQLSALMREVTLEGAVYRRPRDLVLDRPHLPIFALTWTLMHPIDEASPLYGFDEETMNSESVRLFLSVHAHDTALNADVQDMKDFGPEKVLFNTRYQDAVSFDDQGRTFADLTRISLVEADL
ncbi:MAG TPA: ion channel [Caulobacteraceae bacterium]|nr:ion channel [Caulobacteraceae bacterium]